MSNKIDNMQVFTYLLVQWPETQVLMDYGWFDAEASLADFHKFGSSAYFIPQSRWLELVIIYSSLNNTPRHSFKHTSRTSSEALY